MLIAGTTIGFGLVLLAADRRNSLVRQLRQMSFLDALLIGVAQALALVPGVSRSGITMTMALFLSFKREEAARFSLLLSIPTTFAAGVLGSIELYRTADASLQADAALAAVLSFFAALLAIAGLMAWLRRANFMPFVIYRPLLGTGLLAWLLVRSQA